MKQTYVVWIEPRGKEPQNLGVLKVNDDLKGSFEATVPGQDVEVFITAENNPRSRDALMAQAAESRVATLARLVRFQ